MRSITFQIIASLAALACASGPATAQERDVPYWASLAADEVNMRVGPSPNYPIDWVYRRQGLPVKVVRMMQGYRLVQEPDGTQGWIVGRLLSRARRAIVTGEELAQIRELPEETSAVLWNVEPGVVGSLGDCNDGWCEFDVDGSAGFVLEERLWGSGEP